MLSAIDHFHLSNIAPFFKATRPGPNCSLMAFCDCPKLVWALQVMQFRFLIECGTRFHSMYKLY
jgi:hypothetical protein